MDVTVELKARVKRLLAGANRADDLDRIYLGLREPARGMEAVREIGDFIAHRDTRQKGLLHSVFTDVFTSLDVWSRPFRRIPVERDDVVRAAQANLRLANDEQLMSGCGSTRAQATTRLTKALQKIGRAPLKESEAKVLAYLGTAFIWKPAFTSDQLFDEFILALKNCGLVEPHEDEERLERLRAFVTLHALTVMHGSVLTLPHGLTGRLRAGYANAERRLEVKVEIEFVDTTKPIASPICLFLTSLQPEGNCASVLIHDQDPAFPWHWPWPLEVSQQCKLEPLDGLLDSSEEGAVG